MHCNPIVMLVHLQLGQTDGKGIRQAHRRCNSQAKAEQKTYRKSDGKGLYIEIRPTGSKYWRLAYRFTGKQKTLALGVYPEVGLSEARGERDVARKLLRKGIDPLFDRKRRNAEQKAASHNSFEAITRGMA